jgi:hypothetical protein
MSHAWTEFMGSHTSASAAADVDTQVRGFIDPERSTADAALFASDPCATRWVAIPSEVIQHVQVIGEGRCGERAFPEVVLRLRRESALMGALIDALRVVPTTSSSSRREGADVRMLDLSAHAQRRDLRLVFTRFGSIYDWQVYVEGKEVNNPKPVKDTFVYELPNHPIDGALDVAFWVQGINGATGKVAVHVDKQDKPLDPPLQAVVSNGFGRDDRTYTI